MDTLTSTWDKNLLKNLQRILNGEQLVNHPVNDITKEQSSILELLKQLSVEVQNYSNQQKQNTSYPYSFLQSLKRLVELRNAGHDNFSSLLEAYLKVGCDIFNLSSGIIYHVDHQCATCYSIHSDHTALEMGDTFETEYSICEQISKEKTTIHIYPDDNNPIHHPVFGEISCYIGTPIRVNGEIYAIIEFAGQSLNRVGEEGLDQELIELISKDIGAAIYDLMLQQERNKIESALLSSREQFKHVVDNIPGAVYRRSTQINGYYEFMSNEVENITGYPVSFFTDFDNYLRIVHPDDVEQLKMRIEDVAHYHQSMNLEYRIIHRTGDIRWVAERGTVSVAPIKKEMVLDGVIFDITDLKATEQALTKSENRYKLVTSYSKIGIWDFNFEHAENHLSENIKTILGYQKDELENDFEAFLKLIHPEDLPNVKQNIFNPANKKVHNFEIVCRKIHKNGNIRWIHTRGTLIRSKENILRIAGLDEDITDQKITEEALQKSEERYALATSAGNISVFDHDYVNKTYYISHHLKGILGYKNHELASDPEDLMQLVHPEDRKLVKSRLSRFQKRKNAAYEIEYRMQHKDGSYRWILTRGTIFKDESGSIVRMAGYDMDITDRKLAELEVEKTRKQLQYLFDNLEPVFFSFDAIEKRIIQLSPSFEKLTGYKASKMLENYNFYQKLIHPEDIKSVQTLNEKLSNGKNISVEHRLIRKDKQVRWVNINMSPSKDTSGIVKRYDCIVTDITEQKKQKEILQAKELAEKGLKFKTEFLANMSHEIRTPMNGIIGMIDLLLDTRLSKKQNEFIGTIQQSSKNLLAIINEILDLSKLEAGKMSVNSNIFNLHKLIFNLKDLFSPVIRDKEVDINIRLHRDLPEYIKADETKINQVLTNLMSNAAKFTEEGEINICSRVIGKNKIEIEVRDTGVGISDDDKCKLFQKFTQLNTPTKRKHKGTGLGLVISQHLVELMGGEIEVSSQRFKGSTFRFSFDFQKVNKDSSHFNKQSDDLTKLKNSFDASILLVEDNQVNAQVSSLMLKKYGCKVDVASNGLVALDKASKNHYDLVFMDIQMPIMDGLETTKLLKEKFPDLAPVVGLSANAMEGDIDHFINLGFDDYLTKPIRSDNILAALNKWINPDTDLSKKQCRPKQNNVKAYDVTYIQSMDIVNQKTINEIKEVAGSDITLLQNIFDSFFDDAAQLINESKVAFKNNDYKALQKSIHTLKGLSGTIGAMQLFELAKIINHQLNTSKYKDLNAALNELDSYLNLFENTIDIKSSIDSK